MPALARFVPFYFVSPLTAAGRMAEGKSEQSQPGARASQERFRPACQAAQGKNIPCSRYMRDSYRSKYHVPPFYLPVVRMRSYWSNCSFEKEPKIVGVLMLAMC